jgi:hypothetical protein
VATSGSIDFNLTRNDIITDALKLIGAIEAGETATGEDLNDGARALNKMAKAWQADGLQLWKTEQGVLFLEKDKAEYNIGAGGDNAALLSDSVKTELSTAGATSDTTIVVDSITGFAASDFIGIAQDDDTIHWTTVSGTPSGSSIVLAVGLISAAAVDSHVYGYTNKIDRPLRVLGARRRDPGEQDIPIITFSRQGYWDTPNKTTNSRVVQIYYDPQLTLGIMRVWPEPADPNDRIIFTAQTPIEDFDTATDNPDFPQEWLDALTYGLAVRLCAPFGVPLQDRAWLKGEATEMKQTAMGFDQEPESFYFQPDLHSGGWG